MAEEEFHDAHDWLEHELAAVDALVNLPSAFEAICSSEDEREEETDASFFEPEGDEAEGGPTAQQDNQAGQWLDHDDTQNEPLVRRHSADGLRKEAPATARLQKLRGKLRLLALKHMSKPQHILLKDKLSFLLGCTLLWGCAFWLGASPQTFYQLYTVVGLTMFVIRYFTYRSRRQHYYLFDFCYWANLLLLLHVWLLPDWALLDQATFAFNTGPLTWTILAFRNSLVFHDLDKVTSLFLHMVPALVSWSLRWYPEQTQSTCPSQLPAWTLGSLPTLCSVTNSIRATFQGPQAALEPIPVGLFSQVVVPMTLYLVWACAYYLQIFVFSAKKIQQRGYQTLFKYVTTQQRGAFYNISKRVPKSMQPQVYLALHLCFCLCTLFIAVPCWHSFTMHTVLLATVATSSMWSGAGYYFEVFAKRYHASISEVVRHADATTS